MLSPEAAAAGHQLVHRASVASTMDEARAHVIAGRTEPCWFIADEQTGGRGRHGRSWSSPAGNLYATLALSSPCLPAAAPELGFVAGLALHHAVAEAAYLQHPALAIKWPNDLLLDGAKLAGLLLEGLQAQGGFAALIGFGVNIASAPAGTPYPACSLPAGIAPAGARNAIFASLSRHWLRAFAQWRTEGFAPIRAAWLERAHGIGREVSVRPPGGDITGRMLGLDPDGRLLLATATGEQRIDAGDLFFGH